MSSYVHIDNINKNILLLIEEPTQRLDDNTLTAEAKHPINFYITKRKISISKSTLHWKQPFLIC